MITEVEKAKSDKSRCRNCRRIIYQGNLRLVLVNTYKEHAEYRFLCAKCGKEYIANEIERLTKLSDALNKGLGW